MKFIVYADRLNGWDNYALSVAFHPADLFSTKFKFIFTLNGRKVPNSGRTLMNSKPVIRNSNAARLINECSLFASRSGEAQKSCFWGELIFMEIISFPKTDGRVQKLLSSLRHTWWTLLNLASRELLRLVRKLRHIRALCQCECQSCGCHCLN